MDASPNHELGEVLAKQEVNAFCTYTEELQNSYWLRILAGNSHWLIILAGITCSLHDIHIRQGQGNNQYDSLGDFLALFTV